MIYKFILKNTLFWGAVRDRLYVFQYFNFYLYNKSLPFLSCFFYSLSSFLKSCCLAVTAQMGICCVRPAIALELGSHRGLSLSQTCCPLHSPILPLEGVRVTAWETDLQKLSLIFSDRQRFDTCVVLCNIEFLKFAQLLFSLYVPVACGGWLADVHVQTLITLSTQK